METIIKNENILNETGNNFDKNEDEICSDKEIAKEYIIVNDIIKKGKNELKKYPLTSRNDRDIPYELISKMLKKIK